MRRFRIEKPNDVPVQIGFAVRFLDALYGAWGEENVLRYFVESLKLGEAFDGDAQVNFKVPLLFYRIAKEMPEAKLRKIVRLFLEGYIPDEFLP